MLGFGLIINGFSQSQSDLLESAYQKKSKKMLTQFFENWAKEVQSNESKALNDTISEAFKVFRGFYKPTKLSFLTGNKWENSIYSKSKYFLVQNRLINIFFVDRVYYSNRETDSLTIAKIKEVYESNQTMQSLWISYDKNGRLVDRAVKTFGPNSDEYKIYKSVLVDSINEFYPSIDYEDKKAVYLTQEYYNLIRNYLEKPYSKRDSGVIIPKKTINESWKRHKFIDKLITTFYNPESRFLYLGTQPYAYSITFDKNMKFAKVNYIMTFKGGEAILEKQGDKWVIIKGETTWYDFRTNYNL